VILLHAFSNRLASGLPNAKNYPFWPALLKELALPDVVQIARPEDTALVADCRTTLATADVEQLVKDCEWWLAVDSFLPHLAHMLKKPGIVMWGPSDPRIFGYPEHLNLQPSPPQLRPDPFGLWADCAHSSSRFLPALDAAARIREWRRTHP
jgi:ADP-heptose:LPS heptosyltransferase